MTTEPAPGLGRDAAPAAPVPVEHRLALAEWRLAKERARRSARLVAAVGAARSDRRALLRLPLTLLRVLTTSVAVPPRPTPPPVSPPAPAVQPRAGLLAPELGDPSFPDGPVARPDLRIAALLDEFSERAFAYEADLTQLDPDRWRAQLDETDPHLLLVESAWRGEDDRWRHHVTSPSPPSEQLVDLVATCRERDIPTVFWNKEDPPNYDRFIDAARLFDHVLTVDEGSIPRYLDDLGHDRVGVLPFAAQPRIHHPVLTGPGRDQAVMFAGTYHVDKHPHRKVQVMQVLDPARAHDLHVYARFTARAYRWPPPLDRHVLGSLTYAQTLEAYRRYRVVLNVNSVPTSDTMCARRIFELLACGTTVLSGTSPAIAALLGPGLVHESADPDRTTELLGELLADEDGRARGAARGLRRVLSGHTYGDRLRTVLEVAGLSAVSTSPTTTAVVGISPHASSRWIEDLAAQTRRPDALLLVGRDDDVDAAAAAAVRAGLPAPARRPHDAAPGDSDVLAAAATAGTDLVALLDPATRYGPGYLTDQVQAFAYADVDATVKAAHHVTDGARLAVVDADDEHRRTVRAAEGSVVVRRDVIARHAPSSPRELVTTLGDERVVATSRFDLHREVSALPTGSRPVDGGATRADA